jgi:UDP-glucose 4-epimerase
MKILVTGGAGFIGSHLIDNLLTKQNNVIVIDDLSSGSKGNLPLKSEDRRLVFVQGDLTSWQNWGEVLDGVEVVYHFASNPEVRVGETDPQVHFHQNLTATYRLLEAMRRSRTAKSVIFASTSTVYGDAVTFPTPEDYGPLLPISTYGASKLGCEALISSYAHTFNMRGVILRFANIVGLRSHHGVISDFITKLRQDSKSLEILGDGKQKKSYLHISDCVEAIMLTAESFLKSDKRTDVYNIGSQDQITVQRIAEIVSKELGAESAKFTFTGGVDGGRGWYGDVKTMHLSVGKLQQLGWRAVLNSEEAVRQATKELLAELSKKTKK